MGLRCGRRKNPSWKPQRRRILAKAAMALLLHTPPGLGQGIGLVQLRVRSPPALSATLIRFILATQERHEIRCDRGLVACVRALPGCIPLTHKHTQGPWEDMAEEGAPLSRAAYPVVGIEPGGVLPAGTQPCAGGLIVPFGEEEDTWPPWKWAEEECDRNGREEGRAGKGGVCSRAPSCRASFPDTRWQLSMSACMHESLLYVKTCACATSHTHETRSYAAELESFQ